MPLRRLAALCLALWPAAAPAEVPRVVADIAPVHSLVAQVMGTLGQPELLMDRGADAHDYQMRPSQARALAGADLLVWIGPGMTPWLARAAEGDLAGRSLVLLDVPGTTVLPFAGGAADAAGEEPAGPDPHAWLDPSNASLWLQAIAGALSEADPANAATYAANAAAAHQAIEAADDGVAAMLAPVRGQRIIVYHDALGYFAARYGLRLVQAVAAGDAALPGAGRIAGLRDRLAGTACIFPEAGRDPGLVETLAEGTGVRIGDPLDPEGRDLPPGPALYVQLLQGLGRTIAACAAPPG
ncbi:MAG: zinc ABC transporter substrate-binding protein [Rhodobacteraceae bacterium]|nr:zinc ABC transporter substrate-binding protein [Paracoccaceae bacterium]